MTKIKKAIAIIAMLATVTACFAGCSDSGTNSTTSKSDSSTKSQAAEEKEEKNEESAKEKKKAPAAKIPSDYEFPASPEVIVYQGDKEVFHYAGETPSEVKSMLEDMGINDNGNGCYKVIKEDERLTVKVYGDDMEIDVSKLSDDMRMVVDGMEINLDTRQAIAPDGFVCTDTSTFKPDDFKTKQYATMQIVTNSNTGNIVGCDVGIKNVPEN